MISISSPRGAINDKNSNVITGRLYGRSLFPRSLDIVRSAVLLGLPIIGSGGVWMDADVESMLKAGAMAVETDIRLWVPKEPEA